MFIVHPAACRRVGLSIRRSVTDAVWPAVWPAVLVGGLLSVTRSISSGTLLAVAVQGAIGGLLYLALFFAVAINRRDRAYYFAKMAQLMRKQPLAAAGSV
jgi:ABC-type sulfate transport system permease component